MVFSTERIIYLLRSYTNRTATDAERRELTDWLALHEDDGSFENHIQQLLRAYPAEKETEGVDWEQIYSDILACRNEVSVVRSVHRVHFLKTSWFRYAAAVLIIAGAATAVGVLTNHSSAPVAGVLTSHQDIQPGTNKAILTLADGRKIILDNTANGNVAQQGNTKIIAFDAGQLAYRGTNPPNPLYKGELASASVGYNTIATPRGGQYQITLPDGTKVWLNAASSIKFPAAFAGATRNVEMTGEIYMEVAKNSKQPFMVKANGTEVQVLGTSFNVNAYDDEGSTKTTLIEGSVKVSSIPLVKGGGGDLSHNQGSTILKPGEQAVVKDQGNQVNKVEIAVQDVLAWKNGIFNFNKQSLQEVMRQLERWYDVDVVYDGNIQPKKFGGEIQRDLNLSEVLEVLKETGMHFGIEGKKIIVKP